jgi:hypothetical protein
MACGIFRGCTSLRELIFDLPSCLKQLDLPPSEFGSLSIPDSVEVVFGGIGKQKSQLRLLRFGRESSLMTIELRHEWDSWTANVGGDADSNSFLYLPEKVLRRFRCQFEGL